MRATLSSTLVALTGASLCASSLGSPVTQRDQVNATGLLDCYDYVIVGGGVSGLVVAHRLSENQDTTILVIEAGALDQREDFIMVPGRAGGAVGTLYDWNQTYAANPAIDGRNISIPLGHVVGGGSVLNIMLFDRGSKGDYDLWEELGNDGWSWDGLLPYFKKAETFTPPTAELAEDFNITWDADAHGHSGPLHSSYSPFFWPLVDYFIPALKTLGVNVPLDGANGDAIGAFTVQKAQDPTTATRSSARTAYWDSANNRSNLHLLTNTQVTKLISFPSKNGSAMITGVEFAASKSGARQTIAVKKEAIMAAGAIHTPQILQLSGIGESALLEKFNISTIANVPGVGHNFQDHPMFSTSFNVTYSPQYSNVTNNATFAADALAEYNANLTGPYTTSTGDYLVYLPTESYMESSSSSSLLQVASNQSATAYLDPSTPPAVAAGYKVQHDLLKSTLNSSSIAQLEIIWTDGRMVLAGQHPFSRGSVKIQSPDPFTAPIADSAFLRNPLDAIVLYEGVKFVRKVMALDDVWGSISPEETLPGTNVTADADLEAFVRKTVVTEYHPTGSCHIGSLDMGGCVDNNLRVHGITNLRVVDASTMPLVPATHIQSTVFAVAEKAADLIKADN